MNYANMAHSEFLVNFIYVVFSERKLELVNGDHLSIPGMRDYPYASIENYNQMSPSPKPVTPLSPSAGSLSYNVGELSFLLSSFFDMFDVWWSTCLRIVEQLLSFQVES